MIYYNNGAKYIGEFKRDKLDGKGIFYYSRGGKYFGEFKNSKKEGFGLEYLDKYKYKGCFHLILNSVTLIIVF